MKNTLFKRLGLTVLRSAILFLTFGVIAAVSRFIFDTNLFGDDILSYRQLCAWHTVFLFLIFWSTVFAFNRNKIGTRNLFLEKYTKGQRLGKIRGVFTSLDFYIEYFCIAILSFIFPLPFTYDCVGVTIFNTGYSKTQIMLLVLPILLVIEILVHLSIRNVWVSDSVKLKEGQKEGKEFAKTIKGILLVAGIYCAASLVFPWVLPFFIILSNFSIGTWIYLYIFIAFLVAVLLLIAVFYIRAIKKRKNFIQKLKKYCSKHSITLSNIQKPYLSVFVQQKGIDFTLESDHMSFDCKFVAGVFPNSPIIFSDKGEGLRQSTLKLFKVDVLHLNTRIDYRFENSSENSKKIIIAIPVPKKIYVSVKGGSPRPADTGENMGEYKLYTATGFLNSLERGNL